MNDLEVIFYLTKECNFNCSYCYKKDQGNKKLFSFSKLELIFKELNINELTHFHVRVRGGEFSKILDSLEHIDFIINNLITASKNKVDVTFEFSTNLYGLKNNYYLEMSKIIQRYLELLPKEYHKYFHINIDCSIHSEYFPFDNNYKKDLLMQKIILFFSIFNIFKKIIIIGSQENYKYRIVLDNFPKKDQLKTVQFLENYLKLELDLSINIKLSNTYGLFLDSGREGYSKILVDESLYFTFFKNNKESRILLSKLKEYLYGKNK